jgi:hypothetical protein
MHVFSPIFRNCAFINRHLSLLQYACRKTIAEGRPRVRGRFAKPGEVFEEETEVKTNDIILHKHQEKGTHCDGDAMRALLATIFEEE